MKRLFNIHLLAVAMCGAVVIGKMLRSGCDWEAYLNLALMMINLCFWGYLAGGGK